MKYNFNKNEVINLLKTEKKVQDVATKLNCTLISLQRYMRKENIKVAKRYSDDLRKQVWDLLDTKKYKHKEIASILGLKLCEVRSIIKYRTLKRKANIRFSNKIDETVLSDLRLFWYLIGLISTDGHCSNDTTNGIQIFQNDYEFLHTLQNLLKHFGKIYEYNLDHKCYVLTILSKQLKEFLIKNKICGDKRYCVPFLQCPKEYINYYLRGLFDGDGCLWYKYVSGRMEGQIIQFTTGSSQMKDGLIQCLSQMDISVRSHEKKSMANNIYWDITIANRNDVLNFCNFIYSGTLSFVLKKKYIKFLKLIKLLDLDKQVNEIVEAI